MKKFEKVTPDWLKQKIFEFDITYARIARDLNISRATAIRFKQHIPDKMKATLYYYFQELKEERKEYYKNMKI